MELGVGVDDHYCPRSNRAFGGGACAKLVSVALGRTAICLIGFREGGFDPFGDSCTHLALAIASVRNDIELAFLGQSYEVTGYRLHSSPSNGIAAHLARRSRELVQQLVRWLSLYNSASLDREYLTGLARHLSTKPLDQLTFQNQQRGMPRLYFLERPQMPFG